MKDEAQQAEQNPVTAVAMSETRSQLTLAIERGLDPATINKLMDLQERWDANQAKKAYVAAMAAFKRECPSIIGKDKKVNYGSGKANFRHASIGHIIDIVTPHLSKNGLHVSWETKQGEGKVTVICHVRHEGGHSESTPLTGPYDESGGKNPIQTVGSSVTYLQRYTLVCALGLATADQDDADDHGTATPDWKAPPNSGASNLADRLKTEPAPSVAFKAVGPVDEVNEKKLTSGVTKYGIQVNGEWFGSFSKTDAGAARDAKTQGKTVTIQWEKSKDGKYRNVLTLDVNESAGLTEQEKADINKREAAGELPL